MEIYALDPLEAPARWVISDMECQIAGRWLAIPTEDDGWELRLIMDPHHVQTMRLPRARWPEMVSAVAAFGAQVRGYRPPGEEPAHPEVRWERTPFEWLGTFGSRGQRLAYDAETHTLTINRNFWRKADFYERQRALLSLPGLPLVAMSDTWLYDLILRNRSRWQRPPTPRVVGTAPARCCYKTRTGRVCGRAAPHARPDLGGYVCGRHRGPAE